MGKRKYAFIGDVVSDTHREFSIHTTEPDSPAQDMRKEQKQPRFSKREIGPL